MFSDEGVIDGSWELTVTVTDLQVERTLRVKGDLHIGGVMLRLVEALDLSVDWSDHGLWWPEKNRWLTHSRSTLDQYGVQADARLWFTPMHKNLRLQLPDLQIMDMKVDFSTNVFTVIVKICKELKIRHPEELSLSRKLDREELKKNQGVSATRKPSRPAGLSANHHNSVSSNSLDGTLGGGGSPYRTNSTTPQGTLLRTPGTPGSPYSYGSGGNSPHSPYQFNGTLSPGSMHSLAFEGAMESGLANSPQTPTREALVLLYKPKNFSEKARINAGWLDSSRSVMEQGIRENDIILMRFKYYSFYDLNPKYDSVRINQIYEQAKWALISEEVDCTEEEMMMFAALQLQAQLQMNVAQPDVVDGGATTNGGGVDDEISAALSSLEDTLLDGSTRSGTGDITQIPKLQDYLRFFKPKKFTIKSYKRYYFIFEDTHLTMHRSQDESSGPPLMKVNLKGCEVNPDINISSQKYNIKLFMPSPEGLSEVWIKAESEQQYANWMAAFRLASTGKTMADSSYESEVQSLQAFLSMQHPAPAPALSSNQVPDLQPEDFVAPRFLRKLKTKQVAQRILEAHSNVREMNLIESKLNYIKAWQALPDYGINYFIVKFKGSKKEELLGVAYNRLIRMDTHSGDSLKTWRFPNMQTWNVNWEIRQVEVAFDSEKIAFQCLTADCKVVHEFIGGYIFLSMRSGDKNQALNEEMFHKLTGGWA